MFACRLAGAVIARKDIPVGEPVMSSPSLLRASLWVTLASAAVAVAVTASSASAQGSRVGAGSPAGRYAPLRDGGKDTGCMITLEAAGRAQLAPACRDQGLVIFDPTHWKLEQGRLALTARKGHKAHFERQSDGLWLRDPKEGKALSLRPI
jgi:hypothetical protein